MTIYLLYKSTGKNKKSATSFENAVNQNSTPVFGWLSSSNINLLVTPINHSLLHAHNLRVANTYRMPKSTVTWRQQGMKLHGLPGLLWFH